ncbi:MAG: LuxR C-terminal-related transcriptional regulator, partial [Solirubrobacterales bacterium]
AALGLLPTDHDRRLELLIARATALGESGSLAESREALLEALSLLPPGSGPDRVRLVALLAAVETLLGRHRDAGRRLHGEFESLADRRSPEAGALQAELAIREAYAGRFDAIPEHAATAHAIAAETGDAVGEAEAGALLAFGELGRGRPEAATRRLDEAAALLDAADDDALARRLGALHYLGHAEQPGERWAQSLRHFERGVELCRATGQGQLLASMLTGQAWAALFLGRLDRAQELSEAAVDSARLGANPLVLVWALLTPTLVGVARGDLTSALVAAEESAELAGRIDVGVFSAQQGWVHGWALLEAGDADRCVEVIEGAGLTDPDHLLVVPGGMCITSELLARAQIERGRPDDAWLWGERGIAFSEQSPPGADAAFGLGARAVGLLEAGQEREAAELALRAAAGAMDVGAPLIEARSRTLAGRALVAAGEPEAAIRELERAHGVLRDRGAVRWADEAARELRKLGRRVARTTRPPVDGATRLPDLSPREREVAELVAEGHTNREVAATLYLSEKTVEGNLRRVFAKLGISRRGQLGSLLRREGDR